MTGEAASTAPVIRVRITYAKGEPLRFISHLDLARTWERAFRRARLPLAYSQGFNPRPRFQMAAALPVGVTGSAELLDLWLVEPWTPAHVLDSLRPALPIGLQAVDAAPVELVAVPLQVRLRAARYTAVVAGPEAPEAIQARVRALLEAPTLPRRRQHKGEWQTYDLRPLLQDVVVEAGTEAQVLLSMRLASGPEGAGRPDELLDALGLSLAVQSIERTRLIFEVEEKS